MRVLVIGATGFIGSAIHAALTARGDTVIATYHGGPARTDEADTLWRRCDIARLGDGDCRALVACADAVINCAGLLQDNAWESTASVHVEGVRALVAAAETAGVRRFIHFSALGADRHEASAFSRTKRAGEHLIMESGLDWVILRPAVVVGRGAFGGSALFRGLAALPVLPVMPETGPLQIVQRDDVVATVLHFLMPGSHARLAMDLAGPQQLSMTEVVSLYRRWLGWQPARLLHLPKWTAGLLYRLGDFARMLGWRPPLGTTAQREMRYGATGDSCPWTAETGITPMRLDEALAREPAGVQERWFAGLYMLKPLGFAVFSLFWMLTGIISLTVGYGYGLALLHEGGIGALAGPMVVAGALADLAVGAGIAMRRTARRGLFGGIALTCFYIVAGTILVPRLWAEPLGPFLKIFPIFVFNLMLLAILEER